MNITVSSVDAQKGFYPTPPALAKSLLDGVDWSWDKVRNVLEPSAGSGNLVMAIAHELRNSFNRNEIDVDMIEIDPAIRGILTDRFSTQARNKLYSHKEHLRDAYLNLKRSGENADDAESLWRTAEDEYYGLECVNTHIVHDDFLTFSSKKQYDLIVMNPPFADGDAHLLKAIQLQERYGGQIRCILNAETLRNPYTNRRKVLSQKLLQLGAEIDFESGAFQDAERKTMVDVAIVKIDIPHPTYESDILTKLIRAREAEEAEAAQPTDLVENDFVKQIVKQFDLEVDVGCELIRQYIAVLPYIQQDMKSDGNWPIIRLAIAKDSAGYGLPSVNDYIKSVRKKYWNVLFKHPQFVRQLTSNLQDELHARVSEYVDFDFSEYNIRTLFVEMNARIEDGVKATILDLFEKLTAEHSWYPECKQNIHYYNGWAANKAHKINSKVIIPVNGIFSVYSWTQDTFNVNNAYKILADIEKVLNYLDGHMTAEVNLERQLRYANTAGKTKNIQLKYFDVSFFKKGTMHIRFTCPDLLERFNIYCGKHKSWLPPCYGHKTYSKMDADERQTVDSFHGDGSPDSGEKTYAVVCGRAGYFLAPPNRQQIAIGEGVA